VVKRYEFKMADNAAFKSIEAVCIHNLNNTTRMEVAASVTQLLYANDDSTQDKKEHHCVLFNGAVPVSVVGTYGGFGYFEGTFITPAAADGGPSQALVSWLVVSD
jgi:hypothetical protein